MERRHDQLTRLREPRRVDHRRRARTNARPRAHRADRRSHSPIESHKPRARTTRVQGRNSPQLDRQYAESSSSWSAKLESLPDQIPIRFAAPTSSSSRTPSTIGARRREVFSMSHPSSLWRSCRPKGQTPIRKSLNIWRSAPAWSWSWTRRVERFPPISRTVRSRTTENARPCRATTRCRDSICVSGTFSTCSVRL